MDTNFKKEVISDLNNKNLSSSSIKLYLNNLERLNDELPLKNLDFLTDIDKIESKISNLKLTTQRSYLISICSVLEMYKDKTKKLGTLYNKYYKKMIDINEQIKAIPTENMSDKQKDNWMTWNDVVDKFKEKYDSIKSLENNDNISKNNYNKILEVMVLALYVYNEPRRNEYINMMLVKKYTPTMSKEHNYLSYDDKKIYFLKYKTSKQKGEEVFNINDDLMNVINIYLKFHPLLKNKKINNKMAIPFLVNYDGDSLPSPNGITRILNKIFGKNISSSMLRHIYLSSLYGDTLKKMKETAKKMGHSVQTQKEYIKDDDDTTVNFD
jgi:hypothetical protein